MGKNLWTVRQEKLQALLRTLRRESRLTQMQLAEKLGRPQSYVSKYESGERRLDILELQDICIACGTTLTRFCKRLESGQAASDSGTSM